MVEQAYRIALSRKPSAVELKLAREFFKSGGANEDFCLALLNRNEFVYAP